MVLLRDLDFFPVPDLHPVRHFPIPQNLRDRRSHSLHNGMCLAFGWEALPGGRKRESEVPMAPDYINTTGLVLDIVGVALVYRFGLPSDVEHPDSGIGVAWGTPADERRSREKRWRRHRFWSRFGLVLLGCGFALQILSNHVGVRTPIILPAISCPP